MLTRKRTFLYCAFLLVLAGLPKEGFAYTYTQEFAPDKYYPFDYWKSKTWSDKLIPYSSGGTAGANRLSGSIGVYAAAWVGGGASEAEHIIKIYVPARSSVKATAKIKYVGGTVNFGYGSFSGTEWFWQLNDGSKHRHDIDPPFSWDIIAGKIIDLVFLAAGGLVPEGSTLAKSVEYMELIYNCAQLISNLNDLIHSGDAQELNKSFSFTINEGWHTLGVGLRANASGCVTGSGFAVMAGCLEKITLQITNDYVELPDVTISDIVILHEAVREEQVGERASFGTYISNIGESVAGNNKIAFYVLKPGDTEYTCVCDETGNYTNFEPHTTYMWTLDYTFSKKGTHYYMSLADPLYMVPESDEDNNVMVKSLYVIGLPPSIPSTPAGVPEDYIMYRNDVYTLSTSATDPDNDQLMYKFKIRNNEEDWCYLPGWTWENEGWHDTNSIDFSPTCDNKVGQNPGVYCLSAQVIDSDGLLSEWSDEVSFLYQENRVPDAPSITGPDSGYECHDVCFTVSGSDQDGDDLTYKLSWGDGSPHSDWYLPELGENSVTVSHKYEEIGTFYIYAKAKDTYCETETGSESGWSTSKMITIEKYFGAIEVTTNHPDATFSITGPNEFSGSGTSWTSERANPGTYTISYGDIYAYNTPPNSEQELEISGSILFEGEYTHKTGTVAVTTNHDSASFTVTGSGTAQGQTLTGSGTSQTWPGAYMGDHTITFGPTEGFYLPPTQGQKQTLVENETIHFEGTYLLPMNAQLEVPVEDKIAIKHETVVNFIGDGSSNPNPDVNIIKYEFDFGDGSTYVETDDVHADGAFDGNTPHVYSKCGIYTAILTVYDPYGNFESDSETVTVKVRPRAHMSINISRPIAGEDVGFEGYGTDEDGDEIVAYQWHSNIDGNFSDVASFTSNLLSAGEHTIGLKVQDIDGFWSKEAESFLPVYEPREWPMFKQNERRLSTEISYGERIYGELSYSASGQWPTSGAINGSPAAANLDGDYTNGLEIAFVSGDGNLYVLDSSGNYLLWSKPIGSSMSTPAIDNLEPNGAPCVVVGSPNGVYAFDSNGTQKWLFTSPDSASFYSTPVIANINFDPNDPNDGKETVIGCMNGRVYAIDSNGSSLWEYPPSPSPALNAFIGSAAVAEIDPNIDGLETVIGCINGRVYVLDASGNLIAFWPTGSTVGPIWTTPAIAHMVPNASAIGGVETNIVFGSSDGNLYCLWYDCQTQSLAPSSAWGYPFTVNPLAVILSSPAISVVGEMCESNVVFGCNNGNVYLLQGSTGFLIGQYNCGSAVRSTCAIANIDTVHNIYPWSGDQAEVIFGATDGNLYAVSFAGGGMGVDLPWSPMALPASSTVSSPAVCDINHDPEMEILIGGSDGVLYVIIPLKDPNSKPQADFVADTVSGSSPLAVSFTNLTTSDPNLRLTWSWDFGDGSTAINQEPNHTYTQPGSYTVSLTVTNAHGIETEKKENYITVNSELAADLNRDGRVNYNDLKLMTDDWLETDYLEIVRDPCTESLVVHYKFDETTGPIAYDCTDNGYHGTVKYIYDNNEYLVDSGWDANGRNSGCIDFNGTFGLSVPDDVFSHIDEKITISLWINCPNDHPMQENWLPLFNSDNNTTLCSWCPTPGPPVFDWPHCIHWRVKQTGCPDDVVWWGRGEPNDFANQWNHYALTKDCDANTMSIYHNGELVVHKSDANNISTVSTCNFWIATTDGSCCYWVGRVDDFQIYNQVLSDGEIKYLAGYPPGQTVYYYPLESPANLYDKDNIISFKDFTLLAEKWLVSFE